MEFTAVLEKLPVTGYAEQNAPIKFAKPRAINSWLGSTLYLFFLANALAIAMLSRKPIIGRTMRPPSIRVRICIVVIVLFPS